MWDIITAPFFFERFLSYSGSKCDKAQNSANFLGTSLKYVFKRSNTLQEIERIQVTMIMYYM